MQGIFEGLTKLYEHINDDHHGNELSVSLDNRDLECLEAASLLHNIGLYIGKKGYHKQSYRIILVCAFSLLSIFHLSFAWRILLNLYSLFQCMLCVQNNLLP